MFDLYNPNAKDAASDFSDTWHYRTKNTRFIRVIGFVISLILIVFSLCCLAIEYARYTKGVSKTVKIDNYDSKIEELASNELHSRKEIWAKQIDEYQKIIDEKKKWSEKTISKDLYPWIESTYPNELHVAIMARPQEPYAPSREEGVLFLITIVLFTTTVGLWWFVSDLRKRWILTRYLKIHRKLHGQE